ncbi:GNAT family N-acetyltransferase [Sporobolomyces koalae]|uniref:GNAT family N-acetyltransferase n=1 Tax=Sporobolomyces koalae TaxID=500713 RepID=UPI00317091F6
MPFLNEYQKPAELAQGPHHASTQLADYDLNFCYSVPPVLETAGGVRLYPLIPSIHAERLYELSLPFPESYKWLPYGPFRNFYQYLTFLETIRRDPYSLLFVVYDLSLKFHDEDPREDYEAEGGSGLRPERIAGIVGALKSVPKNRSSEIGHLHIAPPFQRTHVLTHSIALLLEYLLSPATSTKPYQLGLRRVQWFSNELNQPSVSAAIRLGFELEASSLKWERVTSRAKFGLPLPDFLNGERREAEEELGGGRHSSVLRIGWDDWEERGVKNHVETLLNRPVVKKRIEDVKFE